MDSAELLKSATVIRMDRSQMFVLRCESPLSKEAFNNLHNAWRKATAGTEFENVKLVVLEAGISLHVVDAAIYASMEKS